MQLRIALSLLGLLLFSSLSAQKLTGRVFDESGEGLPHASIYLKGTTRGVITDPDGNYTLELSAGTQVVVAKYLGYKSEEVELQIKPGVNTKDFRLQSEALELNEVVITDKGKDPAYAIIKKAIQRRKENEIPYKEFGFQSYTKTVIRIDAAIDSTESGGLIGMTMPKEDTADFEAMENEIAFLEENITRVNVKGGKRKEEIISTKTLGDGGDYSFMGNMLARMFEFSPYKNLVPFTGVAPRGIVSPISSSAFIFYDYKLEGSVRSHGKKAYKIKVIPKRERDPIFSGTIYILDETYGVQGLDLMVTKKAGINFFDTLNIKQDFVPLNDSVWIPFNTRFDPIFNLKIAFFDLGLDISSTQVNTAFEVAPELPKRYFNNAIISFGDSAASRDSMYWVETRPVPLQLDEQRQYFVVDSTTAADEEEENAPRNLDSLTRVRNKFRPLGFIQDGYSHYNYRTRSRTSFSSLLSQFGFNPMEGFRIGMAATKRWPLAKKEDDKDRLSLKANAAVRYGFSNRKFSWKAGLEGKFSMKTRDVFRLDFGDYPSEFSDFTMIDPLLDVTYSLFLKRNFLRMQQNWFVGSSYRFEVANGMFLGGGARWEDRRPMPVLSQYSFFRKDENYTENIVFPRHQALFADLSLSFTPGNKYVKLPDRKINLGSKWPTFFLNYRKGISGLLGSDVSYDRLSGGVRDDRRLGLLGKFSGWVGGGLWLSSDSVGFADRKHFRSNQTVIRFPGVRQFNLMPYYSYSTSGAWAEGHAEQAFRGFLLNKIPLIKLLKLHEYAGVHYLWTAEQGSYLEANFGLEKRILKGAIPLRFDFHYRFLGDVGNRWGVTFTWFIRNGGVSLGLD